MESQLKWSVSQNGISIDTQMDIGVHKLPSGTVVVILPGVDGSVDGFENKYVRMADSIVTDQNKAVVRASNPFISSYHWEENFRRLIEYVDENAQAIAGNKHVTIEVIAHSAGASVAGWLAWEYPHIHKLLLINTAAKLEPEKIIEGLNKFKGDKTLVYGSEDPSKDFADTLPASCKQIVIKGADHHFSGEHLNTFINLSKYLE